MASSLVFVKRTPESEEMATLALTSGSVLTLGDGGNMTRFEVGDTASLRNHLGKMKVDDIKETCRALGFRLSATAGGRAVRMTKDVLINAFVEHWEAIRGRAVSRASASVASSSTTAQGEAVVPFHGSGHRLADETATVRVEIIHHDDGRKNSLGDLMLQIDSKLSVSALVADTTKGISGTFRESYGSNQVLMFKGAYMTNMTASLESLGFSSDGTNRVICHVYEEGDPEFQAIMGRGSAHLSSEDEEEEKPNEPSVFEKFAGIQAFRVVGFENGKPVLEKYDMGNKDKDDDANSDIPISDLFNDDDEPLTIDETYLKDPVDFMDEADKNPVTLTIKEPKGGRHLLTMNLNHRQFTIDQLKGLIVQVISDKPSYDKKKGITKDNFCLLVDGAKYDRVDELAEIIDERIPEIEMTMMLSLKGGGKKMPSIQKAKKVRELKVKLEEQKVGASSVVSAEMATAKGIIELFIRNVEQNPVEAMKGFLGGNTMANLNSIVEKLDDTSTGTADGKMRSIAHYFFGDVFIKMDIEKSEREKVLVWAKSSLEWAFNSAGETETGLNLTKFRDMIEKAKMFKEGQMSSAVNPETGATAMEMAE